MKPDATETPQSKATGLGTPVPPARQRGKGIAKKRWKTCVTPAFVIALEIRGSDVRDDRAGDYLCSPSAGRRVGLCQAGFFWGQPWATLGWWEGLPEVLWAGSSGSVGLVDADSLAEPEGDVCLPTCPACHRLIPCVGCRYRSGVWSEGTPDVSPFVSVSWWPFLQGNGGLTDNCQERILKYSRSWCHKSVNCHDNEFKQPLLMQTCCIPASLAGNDANASGGFHFSLLCHLGKNSHSIIFPP